MRCLSKQKSLSTFIITLLAISVSLTSCLTAKNLDKEVAKQYGWQTSQPAPKQKEFLKVSSPLVDHKNQVSTSNSKTSKMLPLLFYWQWEVKVSCAINKQIPINNFTKTVTAYAEKGLKQKLNGRRIELNVEKIPGNFAIVDEARLVWIIYAFGWDKIYAKPVNHDMVVSYKVMDGETEVKKGTISVPAFDEKMQLGSYNSWKTATTDYLYQYDNTITTVSKKVIDKIVEEL